MLKRKMTLIPFKLLIIVFCLLATGCATYDQGHTRLDEIGKSTKLIQGYNDASY